MDQLPRIINRKATVFSRRYINCPACGQGPIYVEHLFEDQEKLKAEGKPPTEFKSEWTCNNSDCGNSFSIHMSMTQEITVDVVLNKKQIHTSVLLVCELSEQELLFLLVKGMRYQSHKHTDEEEERHRQYYYEEHTCPTNYLHDAVTAITLTAGCVDYPNGDPHGLFEYVGSIDGDAGELHDKNPLEIFELFGLRPDGSKKPKMLPPGEDKTDAPTD